MHHVFPAVLAKPLKEQFAIQTPFSFLVALEGRAGHLELSVFTFYGSGSV